MQGQHSPPTMESYSYSEAWTLDSVPVVPVGGGGRPRRIITAISAATAMTFAMATLVLQRIFHTASTQFQHSWSSKRTRGGRRKRQRWLFFTIFPLTLTCVVFIHFTRMAGEEFVSTIPSISDSTTPKDTLPLRSFIDPVWAEWGTEDGQYETLVPPSEIDDSIENRLHWDQSNSHCDDVFLFMPQIFARNGHGSQLNSYLLAAMMATYLGKAMVLLEATQKYSRYPNGSQFGCPIDAFQDPEESLNFEGKDHGALRMKPHFPIGLKRLIVHPTWISRDCPVPKCNKLFYNSWDAIRTEQRDNFLSVLPPREITCDTPTGNVKVTVMGGEEVRQFFDRQFKYKMIDRSDHRARERAYEWATRLGGTHQQAEVFSKLTHETEIWDYISALIARSGLITFQPWIARDVKEFIRSTRLPLDSPHDAIHVRRGDKLEVDLREEVVMYWHNQGYERQVDFPLNYIPFTQYLRLWETDCSDVWGVSSINNRPARTIYVATDDPITVQDEISKLPRGKDGTTIVGGCERVKLIISPVTESSYHIGEGGHKVDCVERYKRNIHSIADLMILTKSNTFVGEYVSNWGRIVRTFRARLNDKYVMHDSSLRWGAMFREDGITEEPPVLFHDTRIAFGEGRQIQPPGW